MMVTTGTWRTNVGRPPALFAMSDVTASFPLFLFFQAAIRDAPACSSPKILQIRDMIFGTRHLLISNGPSDTSPMTLSGVVPLPTVELIIYSPILHHETELANGHTVQSTTEVET
jgi:hypothetical protein